jgi:heterodisulfide reductase subunit A
MEPGPVEGPAGVLSSYQLERMLHPDGPTGGRLVGPDGAPPRAVLLASAADGAPGGDLAAREILKLAHLVKARHPEAAVAVAGGLERSPELVAEADVLRAQGVELLLGAPGAIAAAGGRLEVQLGGPEGVRAADLVVIHAPPHPAAGAAALARLFRIDLTRAGFLSDRAASPFEPTATRIAGVYVAGAAAGPRSIHQAIRDGAAAAGLVLASLEPGERRPLEPLAAEVEAALCGGCGICAAACPFGAVVIERATGKASVEAVHCRGCGTCAAACPTGATGARHFTRAQIAAEISALLAGGTP